MDRRDARLRAELIALIVLKIGILTVLWFAFVRGAHVPVDAGSMARHSTQAVGFSATGEPDGH